LVTNYFHPVGPGDAGADPPAFAVWDRL